MGGNVQVYVRCRPLLQKEEEDEVSVLSFTTDTNQVCLKGGYYIYIENSCQDCPKHSMYDVSYIMKSYTLHTVVESG